MTAGPGPRGRPYPSLSRLAQKAVTHLHRTLYAVSDGRIGGSLAGNPVAVLTTTGRRSGQPRSTPLFAYRDGADYLVVASNGGTASHPAWFLNLQANPDAELRVGRRQWRVRAHVLGDDEKARWWRKVVESYPSYASYQQRTDRPIPLVRLSPR